MKLQFKLNNEVKILEIEESKELLVGDLISEISNKYNINGITLLLNDIELEPEKTIESYGINEDSIIAVIIITDVTKNTASTISDAVAGIFGSTQVLSVCTGGASAAMFSPPTGDWIFGKK